MLMTILYVLLGFVSVLMGLAILLQEPKQAGLSGAFGLGGDSQMLGTSPTSGIAKLTRLLAVIFFALCLGVGILAKDQSTSSMIQDDPQNPAVTAGSDETAGLGDSIGDAIGEETATDGGTISSEVVAPVIVENGEDEGAAVEASDSDSAETSEETTETNTGEESGGAGQR